MIDCNKIYSMVLTDDDGKTYKSDFVKIYNTKLHRLDWTKEVVLDMKIESHELVISEPEAGTPPEMPLAAVAAKATKIIQEEKRKKAIEKEWMQLTDEVCKAVKKGESYIYVKSLWMEDEKRLIEMGYEVSKIDTENGRVWKIRWAEPFYLS